MRYWVFLFTLMLLPVAAPWAATDDLPGDMFPTAEAIPEAEWRRMVRGRTVTYRIGADLWAFERYAPRGNGVEIQLMDGTCMTGTWSFEDGAYCFNWNAELNSCFYHLRNEGQILIVPLVEGGEGAVQTVSAISDLPLTCGPTLSS